MLWDVPALKFIMIHPSKIIFYLLISLIILILIGLVGAILRLINIPAIIITLILIAGLRYYKRFEL